MLSRRSYMFFFVFSVELYLSQFGSNTCKSHRSISVTCLLTWIWRGQYFACVIVSTSHLVLKYDFFNSKECKYIFTPLHYQNFKTCYWSSSKTLISTTTHPGHHRCRSSSLPTTFVLSFFRGPIPPVEISNLENRSRSEIPVVAGKMCEFEGSHVQHTWELPWGDRQGRKGHWASLLAAAADYNDRRSMLHIRNIRSIYSITKKEKKRNNSTVGILIGFTHISGTHRVGFFTNMYTWQNLMSKLKTRRERERGGGMPVKLTGR